MTTPFWAYAPGILSAIFMSFSVFATHARTASLWGMMSSGFFSIFLMCEGYSFFGFQVLLISTLLFVHFLTGGLHLSWLESKPSKAVQGLSIASVIALIALLIDAFFSQQSVMKTMPVGQDRFKGLAAIGHSLVEGRILDAIIFGITIVILIVGFGGLVRADASTERSSATSKNEAKEVT